MADDYGDESGQRIYYALSRAAFAAAQRSGITASKHALSDTASRIEDALADARSQALSVGEEARGAGAPAYAKLDMRELEGVGAFEELKDAIHEDLESHGVGNGFLEGEDGHARLVFRVDDAPKVAERLEHIIGQTRDAAERAGRDAREPGHDGRKGPGRDQEPLDERARRARESSAALREEGTARGREAARAMAPRREERSQ